MSHGLHYPRLVGEMVHTKIDETPFYFVIGFHYVAQTGLEFAHSSFASIFQVLELKVYATMPRL